MARIYMKHSWPFVTTKCDLILTSVFGFFGGKCLGFLVDERGIEANPDKIRAILDMKSPTSVKEVQKLTRCVAALGRFMSKSADKCSPFFKTLKQTNFEWMRGRGILQPVERILIFSTKTSFTYQRRNLSFIRLSLGKLFVRSIDFWKGKETAPCLLHKSCFSHLGG